MRRETQTITFDLALQDEPIGRWDWTRDLCRISGEITATADIDAAGAVDDYDGIRVRVTALELAGGGLLTRRMLRALLWGHRDKLDFESAVFDLVEPQLRNLFEGRPFGTFAGSVLRIGEVPEGQEKCGTALQPVAAAG